jgi:hypothetical protein
MPDRCTDPTCEQNWPECGTLVVLSAYGVAWCDLPKGHTGDHDTTAFDKELWPDE